jgi:hypothetical protein
MAAVCMAIMWLAGTGALGLVSSSLLVGPTNWAGMTRFISQPEVDLPKARPERGQPGITGLKGLVSSDCAVRAN